ncbi:MAG: ribonuclease P protein subunit [Nitrososphaerales archaeon]|nr:ribonuclease P protein subunit [Nitrososphaerales archaeon]
MNTSYDLKYNELIGRTLTVVSSTDSSLNGASGFVINETKNTFHILDNKRKKIIPKSHCVFNFTNNPDSINGKILIGKPQNRLAKVRKL